MRSAKVCCARHDRRLDASELRAIGAYVKDSGLILIDLVE
jgi:hypothetical protein